MAKLIMSRARPFVLALVLLFSSAFAQARPCSTIERVDAFRKVALPVAFAEQARPLANFSLDSERFPLRVHYVSEDVFEKAERLLSLVEGAWQRQVIEQGFRAPLLDQGEGGNESLDVYLTLVLPALAITVASTDVDATDGIQASYAHIRIDPSVDDEILPAFVEHEFQHVVQFATDMRASLMFFEASAVVQERLAYPEIGSWFENYEDFQSRPNVPIFANGIEWEAMTAERSLLEYGASMFLLYLEQEHGDFDGRLIRRLWEGTVQDDGVEQNEPDWLDALADEVSTDLDDLYVDFSTYRALVGARRALDDGPTLADEISGNGRLAARRFLPQALDGAPIVLSDFDRPGQMGCMNFELTTAPGVGYPVNISALLADESSGELSLSYVTFENDTPSPRVIESERGRELSFDYEIDADTERLFALCVLDEVDADEEIVLKDIELRIRRADLPQAPDAGPLPDVATSDGGGIEEPPMPCSCQSSRTGALASLTPILFGLGILGFIFRARKSAKRKKLRKDYEKKRAERES